MHVCVCAQISSVHAKNLRSLCAVLCTLMCACSKSYTFAYAQADITIKSICLYRCLRKCMRIYLGYKQSGNSGACDVIQLQEECIVLEHTSNFMRANPFAWTQSLN